MFLFLDFCRVFLEGSFDCLNDLIIGDDNAYACFFVHLIEVNCVAFAFRGHLVLDKVDAFVQLQRRLPLVVLDLHAELLLVLHLSGLQLRC